METFKLYLVLLALSVASIGGIGYWVWSADNCWGRGALVKNAWGGLSCIPNVK